MQEYLVILHGEVHRDKAFIVPPDCELRFTALTNTTNFIGSNISYSDISNTNTDNYNTGNICEDIVLTGPTGSDLSYPGLCGVIPKNQLNKMELTYYANGQEQLIPAFKKSILKFDYWYTNEGAGNYKPINHNLSDVLTELRKKNPTQRVVLYLLNCRNINIPSYFGDCIGYLPVSKKGNTLLMCNKFTINGVPKLGELVGETIGGEGAESLIMVYELSLAQKIEIIKDIYDENEKKIKNFSIIFRSTKNDRRSESKDTAEPSTIYFYYDNGEIDELTVHYAFRFINKPEDLTVIENNDGFQTILQQDFIDKLEKFDSLDDLLNQLSSNIEMVLFFHPDPPNNCDGYNCEIGELRKRVVSSNLELTNIEEELNKSIVQLKSINVYKLKIPEKLKNNLLKNNDWKTLINLINSNNSKIIKLTGLQPCLVILLNIFINNPEEYEENVEPRIKDLDDTNDLKPTLEILAQSAKVKFGGFVSKRRRRYARSLKKPKTIAASIAVKHHKDPKE
jgi:hypothetical protein